MIKLCKINRRNFLANINLIKIPRIITGSIVIYADSKIVSYKYFQLFSYSRQIALQTVLFKARKLKIVHLLKFGHRFYI